MLAARTIACLLLLLALGGCAPKVPGGTEGAGETDDSASETGTPTGGVTTAPVEPPLDCERPVEWNRRFGGPTSDTVQGLAVDPAGNIFLGLDLRNLDASAPVQFDDFTIVPGQLSNIVFVKLSPAGEVLWARQYGGPADEYLWTFAGCGDGVVFHAGADPGTLDLGDGPLPHENVFAALDGAGDPRWSRSVPVAGDTWLLVTDMACDAAMNVVFTGSRDGDGDLGGGLSQGPEGYVARFDAAGKFLWSRDLGDPDARGFGVAHTPNGDVVVVAHLGNAPLDEDVLLARFDGAGTELWRRGFGPTGYPWSVAVDGAGRIAFSGIFRGDLTLGDDTYTSLSQDLPEDVYGSLYDGFLAQTDANGELLWSLHVASKFEDDIDGLAFDDADVLMTRGIADDLFVLRAFAGPQQTWSWCSPKLYQVRTALSGDDAIVLAPWGYEGDLDLGAGLMPGLGGSDVVVAKLRR